MGTKIDLKALDLDELNIERKKFQDMIDKQDSFHKLSVSGTIDYEFWTGMVEGITKEIALRL